MLFRRRRRLEVELIDALLKGEMDRRKAQGELDGKLAEIELKKRELELANLAAIGEERRKDAVERQKLREQRQQWAANARRRKREKVSGSAQGEFCCALGENPNLRGPALTPELIRAHALHVPRQEIDANGNGLQPT